VSLFAWPMSAGSTSSRAIPKWRDSRSRYWRQFPNLTWIQQGDYGELLAIRFYPETPLTSRFLVVAYREMGSDDGFVL